ncbi:uncharacterized protein LOC143882829 [Tasmannia lanceolata]|uniref:uncharacterized protein LOC143882829 n=1 Tax=Tasmannia lanceolata TaxID=3420 RepID=UPI0040633E17
MQTLFTSESSNAPIWRPTVDGSYTTKSRWNIVRDHSPKVPWAKTIWMKGFVPMFTTTAWKALQNKLSSKDRLIDMGLPVDSRCILCRAEPENIDHIFFQHSFLAWLWRSILWRIGIRRKPLKSIMEEEKWVRDHSLGDSQPAITIKFAFTVAVHKIWAERNARIFEQRSTHKKYILNDILLVTRQKINSLQLSSEITERNIKIAKNFGYRFIGHQCTIKCCTWDKLAEGEHKLNTDASLNDEGGGLGAIIRNNEASVQAMLSVNVETDPIYELEMLAIEKGDVMAKEMDLHQIWIEPDSKFSVDVIKGNAKPPWKKKHA